MINNKFNLKKISLLVKVNNFLGVVKNFFFSFNFSKFKLLALLSLIVPKFNGIFYPDVLVASSIIFMCSIKTYIKL